MQYVQIDALNEQSPTLTTRRALLSVLTKNPPDVHITTCVTEQVLQIASSVSPTVTYAMEHSAICPVGSKYWSTLRMACPVRAGAICTVARPLLGCGARRTSLDREPIDRRRAYAEALRSPMSRIWVPSSDLRSRFLYQGFRPGSVSIVPNLGMRSTIGDLRESANEVPPRLRDRILFVGRLSKEKGAGLLPSLLEYPTLRTTLSVIGDGYLRAQLSDKLGSALMPPTDQRGIAGALMWARGVLFPSLWPEPGGIVGIDAHLFGVPVAGISVGAPLDWPRATLVSRRDLKGFDLWASSLTESRHARDPLPVSTAQTRYWSQVGQRAERLLHEFINGQKWSGHGENPVREALST